MKRLFIHIPALTLAITPPFTAFPQSIPLNGVVVVQNSQYETGKRIYVTDASIRAPFAKSVSSDKDGRFDITFVGVQSGTPLRLTVRKQGMIVVNTREIEQVVVGRTPQCHVVMADEQQLAQAQMTFYHIAEQNINGNFAKKLAALHDDRNGLADRLAVVSDLAHDSLTTLADAMISLTAERDAALQHAQELARTFAEVDLDDASSLYREAYEHFRRGAIDSTLLVLGKEKLDAEFADAIGQKASGQALVELANTRIRQVYQCLELKEGVLKTGVRYKECLDVLGEMAELQGRDADVFNDRDRCRVLLERASVLLFSGALDASKQLGEQACGLARNAFGPDDPLRAAAYEDMGVILFSMGVYDSAATYMDSALSIVQVRSGPDHLDVGLLLVEIAQNETYTGHLDTAVAILDRAAAILDRELPPDDERRTVCNSALGEAYVLSGHPQSALPLFQEDMRIMLAAHGPDGPQLGAHYSNLAMTLNDLGRSGEALAFMEKGLALDLRYLGPDHPDVAVDYNNLSDIYLKANDPSRAVECMRNVLEIQSKSLGPDHPDLVLTYNNLAGVLRRTQELPAALVEVDKGVALADRVLEPGHPWRLAMDLNKGSILERLGDSEGALAAFQHGLDIGEHSEGTDRTSLASIQLSMGHIEEKRDSLNAALALYTTAYATRREYLGPDHRETSIAAYDLGRCQWRRRQLDSARAYLEEASGNFPQGMANWYLFEVAMDAGNEVEALVRLVLSARLREADHYDKPADRDETMTALRQLATKLHREDVLEEFNLN